MKVMVFKRLNYYLTVYAAILATTLKMVLEYRLNFLVQLVYGPAYVLVLYLVMQQVLAKSTHLGGWTNPEIMLLFATFHLLYTTCIIFFMKGVRHFLWMGVRMGETDLALTKPISPQFLLAFSKPEVQQTVLWLGVFWLFVRSFDALNLTLLSVNTGLFLVMFVLGMIICYLSLTTLMPIGFLVSKANQVVELYDKVSDYSTYPTPIFPTELRVLLFTVFPTAFMGYLPTMFLLGRGHWQWIALTLVAVFVFSIINQWVWKMGLRHYASASS